MSRLSPDLYFSNPDTFNATTPDVSVGAVVTQASVGTGRVGLVRQATLGRVVDLVAVDAIVTLAADVVPATPLSQRITVLVEDQEGQPIVGAIVQFSVRTDPGSTIATHVAGPDGKLLVVMHNAVSPENLIAVVETGAAGTANIDLTTALAAAGEAYGVAQYPGPGRDSVALVFAP